MTAPNADRTPVRCAWPGITQADYAVYHDTEWGVPHADSRALFEKIILEGFQSGLSWLTILRKREAFRAAFDGFAPERIAKYADADIARLMADVGIVRNRAKIEAAITNARAYLDLREAGHTFAEYVWDVVDWQPIQNSYAEHADVPAQTRHSVALSKALKSVGFRFVGPTTAYAFMQSVGMVNDHLVTCHRHAPCAALQDAFAAHANSGGVHE